MALTYLESIAVFVALTLVGSVIVYSTFRLLTTIVRGLGYLGHVLLSIRPRSQSKARQAWRDVVLPDDVKGELELWQQVLRHPRAYKRRWRQPLPQGLLLHGPPGVGKGLAAKALAESAGYTLTEVTLAENTQATLGRSQQDLFALFEATRQQGPCLVLLRHLERAHPDLLSAAMREAAYESKQVITVGTTEHLEDVNPPLRALFPLELAVALPDVRLRARLFARYTRSYRRRLAYPLEELARASEGLSGRDVSAVCQTAVTLAHRRQKRSVGRQEFTEAFKRCCGRADGNDLKAPCFVCQGDDPDCPACRGTGYVQVAPSQCHGA